MSEKNEERNVNDDGEDYAPRKFERHKFGIIIPPFYLYSRINFVSP